MIGKTLGHYRIVEQIGAGGMGVVYRARDERLERDVALKVLPQGVLADEAARKRFRKEALALSRLNHPNIATVHDFDTDQGTDFLVMEYIPGTTLGDRLAAGSLLEKEVLRLGMQMAQGLAAAHAEGVTHRDLKPGNLRITPDGRLKILDFGLATLVGPAGEGAATASEVYSGAAGTLAYMSPEQLRGEEVGTRSDIYAAGAVLYEMVAGRRLFPEAQGPRLIADILNMTPDPPPASPALANIILKATDKDPARRYQSARELLVDLERASTPSVVSVATVAQRHLRWGTWAAAAVVLALLAVAATVIYSRRGGAPGRIESLAVMPFENLSGDPQQEYFADGMTEALIADLAKIKALRVLPRTAVSSYRGAKKPPAQVAKELGVDAILEGSVVRSGERVRVTANLIQAAANRLLWSESYEREMRDILALQSEVARAIAQEIRVQLTPQEQARLSRSRTVNPEAYEAYLRGKFHVLRQNPADNATAIKTLERAVALDPAFAPAYAELAHAYAAKVFQFAPQDVESAEKAFVAAEKALSLEADLPEAHLARGLLLWSPSNHFPHEKALQEYRRALLLNPDLDEAHHQQALIYLHIGLFDKALQEFQKTVTLNPSSALARHRIGVTYLYQGKYQEALDLFLTTPKEFNPTLWAHHVTWSLSYLDRKQEAFTMIEEQLKRDQQDRGGLLNAMQALLLAASGRQAEAGARIRRALTQGRGFGHFHHASYLIASAYAVMNKPESALKYLESGAENGLPCYPLFAADPNLANLRSDARFIAFMDKLRKQWERWKATL